MFSNARHAHPGDALINKLMVQSLRARETMAQQIMRPRDQVVALWLDRLRGGKFAHPRRPVVTAGFPFVSARSTRWMDCCSCANGSGRQIQALGPDTPFAPLVREVVQFELNTPLHSMIERFRSALAATSTPWCSTATNASRESSRSRTCSRKSSGTHP